MSELPRVAIHDIAIQERENEIVLGTHGRGIYIASLSEAQKLAGDKAYYEKKKSEVKQTSGPLSPDNLMEVCLFAVACKQADFFINNRLA